MDKPITPQDFRRRFRNLILMTWLVPPVFGLSFLIYIDMFTASQMFDILMSPIEPVFVLAWIFITLWYFPKRFNHIANALEGSEQINENEILQSMRRFPLHYWGLFLTYLLMAPTSVIVSGIYFSDYIATPEDWFKIHLVALIVSIIVGLPIFFLILDLFGLVVGKLHLTTTHITLKTKVFLIGALVPLLIDTMLVQYYWTRTGFFTYETFLVWLTLELLAVGGSLIFVRSIGQSLSPLQRLIEAIPDVKFPELMQLIPMSTDELGVLTSDYRILLEELYAHRNNLEELVQLRTHELSSMNAELESFAYSVSHDLRAPLRAIHGFSSVLIEDFDKQLDVEAQQYLQKIMAASVRMSTIIDALLKLSRVSRSELNRQTVNLSQLVEKLLASQCGAQDESRVIVTIEPNLVVKADRGLMQVLFENLLSNAFKFTKNIDKPEIKIGKMQSSGLEYFYVADNGIGFDMTYSAKLFQPFQRLHSDQEYDGLGIGLATVNRVIRRHGGVIWAKSEPNKGATFYFNLASSKIPESECNYRAVNYT